MIWVNWFLHKCTHITQFNSSGYWLRLAPYFKTSNQQQQQKTHTQKLNEMSIATFTVRMSSNRNSLWQFSTSWLHIARWGNVKLVGNIDYPMNLERDY